MADREAFEARFKTLGYADAPREACARTLGADVLAQTIARGSAEDPSAVAPLPKLSLATPVPTEGSPGQGSADLVVVARLGEGGMGAVDLARQQSLARDVAVKRLRAGVAEASHAAALVHEARVMGRLEHPGVVPVHALGVDHEGKPVLVMKRVSGVAWSALIEDDAHPYWDKLAPEGGDRTLVHVDVARHVSNALSFAHAMNVVHRDIKPDNVMVGEFGEVYLLDWGVALDRGAPGLAATPTLVGTPCFMAPELFHGTAREHDARTDVYLLGATLHAALTKTPRHEGATLHAVLFAAYESAPVDYPAGVPEELAALCNAATHRDPAQRPQSAEAFRRRLAEYVQRRGSNALARSAQRALAGALALDDRASMAARAHLTEAHFGFVQALREWPGNAAAAAGLQATLEAQAERELSLRNAEGARALIEEMRAPKPALREALAALQRALDEERQQAQQGRAQAKEMDASVSAGARAAVIVIGVGVLLVWNIVLVVQGRVDLHDLSTYQRLIRADLALLTAFGAAAAVFHKRLMANQFSRRFNAMIFALLLGGTLSDVAGWKRSLDAHSLVTHKFLLAGFILAVSGAMLDQAILVPATALLVAAMTVLTFPAYVGPVSDGVTLFAAVALVWIALRKAKKPA